MTEDAFELEGGCTCRAVRYYLSSNPLFVHCCHCTWCQRETGSAFALNAMIEADRFVLLSGELDVVHTPSNSGKGQKITRCAQCRVAVWSNYAGAGDAIRFVRVGTLDRAFRLPPDIHIFTSTKQPWVVLAPGTPAVAEYYDRNVYWPAKSLARRRLLLGTYGGTAMRKIASILFLLTGVVIGLGAFGHDSNTAKLAAEFARFPAFDERSLKIIMAVWHFCSGCMLTFGAVLVWTWWRIRQGAREVFFAPYVIGTLYVASGALSVVYTSVGFFWLFVVLGVLLIASAAVLHKVP